jgi:hypothetical protein
MNLSIIVAVGSIRSTTSCVLLFQSLKLWKSRTHEVVDLIECKFEHSFIQHRRQGLKTADGVILNYSVLKLFIGFDNAALIA